MEHQHNPEIAIIVLNYNGRKWLELFLPSVVKYSPESVASIWVADNNSTDGSLEFIQEHFKTIHTIRLNQNYGYAEGYNQAIRQIPCKYALLLNSDVEVTPNWLTPLYQVLEKDSTIAACQPKLLDYKSKDTFEYAGAAGGFIDRYGYPFCRGRLFDQMEKDTGQYDDEAEIFWSSGACMLIRKDLFTTVGGFDGDFFAHMEEIDLCWRLKRLGYKIQYVPSSVIYHVGGGTLNVQNPRKTFLNFRNNRLLLLKNLEKDTVFRVNLIRNVLDFISLVMELLGLRFKNVRAILQAHLAYRKMKLSALEKRKQFDEILQEHKIGPPNLTGIYPKSVVVAFFIQFKKQFSQLEW